jgi:hypothetical protein
LGGIQHVYWGHAEHVNSLCAFAFDTQDFGQQLLPLLLLPYLSSQTPHLDPRRRALVVYPGHLKSLPIRIGSLWYGTGPAESSSNHIAIIKSSSFNFSFLQTLARRPSPNPNPNPLRLSFSSRLLGRGLACLSDASLGELSRCLRLEGRLDSELPVDVSVSLRLRSLRTGVGDAVRCAC